MNHQRPSIMQGNQVPSSLASSSSAVRRVPPPPPTGRPNINERISMLQMAMLNHKHNKINNGNHGYHPALRQPDAIALVLPPLPPQSIMPQTAPATETYSKPVLTNESKTPKKQGSAFLRRLKDGLGSKSKTKKKSDDHPPMDDVITVRRLDESEW